MMKIMLLLISMLCFLGTNINICWLRKKLPFIKIAEGCLYG